MVGVPGLMLSREVRVGTEHWELLASGKHVASGTVCHIHPSNPAPGQLEVEAKSVVDPCELSLPWAPFVGSPRPQQPLTRGPLLLPCCLF